MINIKINLELIAIEDVDNAIQWAKEHCSGFISCTTPGYGFKYCNRKSNLPNPIIAESILEFSNEDDALLFKLTWT